MVSRSLDFLLIPISTTSARSYFLVLVVVKYTFMLDRALGRLLAAKARLRGGVLSSKVRIRSAASPMGRRNIHFSFAVAYDSACLGL